MTRSKNSKGEPQARRATASGESSANSAVGYGNPPHEFRWVPGQSGNPHGRPRRAKTTPFSKRSDPLRDMIMEEMGRTVEIKEGGRLIGIEAARAIMRSLAIGAMQGDLRKQKLALQIGTDAEQSVKAERAERARFLALYKVKFDPIFSAAAKSGEPEPEQLPHPDHVDIDLTTGEMIITGPLTPVEKQQWDHLKFRLRQSAKVLDEMVAAAAAKPRSRDASNRVALVQQHLVTLEQEVPPGWNWQENLGWEDAHTAKFLAPRTRSD